MKFEFQTGTTTNTFLVDGYWVYTPLVSDRSFNVVVRAWMGSERCLDFQLLLSGLSALFPWQCWGSDGLLSFCPLCPVQSKLAEFLLIEHSQKPCGFPMYVIETRSFGQEASPQVPPRQSHLYHWLLSKWPKGSTSHILIPWKRPLCDCPQWPFVPSKARPKAEHFPNR